MKYFGKVKYKSRSLYYLNDEPVLSVSGYMFIMYRKAYDPKVKKICIIGVTIDPVTLATQVASIRYPYDANILKNHHIEMLPDIAVSQVDPDTLTRWGVYGDKETKI